MGKSISGRTKINKLKVIEKGFFIIDMEDLSRVLKFQKEGANLNAPAAGRRNSRQSPRDEKFLSC